MSNYTKNINCDSSMINGNSIDLIVRDCDTEIKADVKVSEFNSVRVWGQVTNCEGEPVPNVLVKLVRVVKTYDSCVYQGIAHSVSDCEGFYQFDICTDNDHCAYKIIVNKSAVGPERVIAPTEGNCCACTNPGYTPCGEYVHHITAPDKINCKEQTCSCQTQQCSNNSHHSCSNHVIYEECEVHQERPCTKTPAPKKNKRCDSHLKGCVHAPSKIRF